MSINIKFLNTIILLSIIILNSSKAELSNKVVISVGEEIITNYDISREIKYLEVITAGRFKNLDNEESRKKIAIDSLIKDKIKINALESHRNIIIKEDLVDAQLIRSSQNIGFGNIDEMKLYLEIENYGFDEFKKKILLELKWNQLIFQFYRNQIIINKEKIDKKLKKLIAEQKKITEYLVYEIFIEDTAITTLDQKNEEKQRLIEEEEKKLLEEEEKKSKEEQDGIIIEAESAHYNNKKNMAKKENSIKEVVDTKISAKVAIEDVILNIEKKGFENTAIEFSSSPTAKQGGSLGWINESKFSPELLKSLKNTKIGSITEPINIFGGVLILKVEDKKVSKSEINLEKKMEELIEIEKNIQLNNFSTNYFNQLKNSTKITYFNE